MFYENQMVHIPDSPRNQNPEVWMSGKSLRTQHKHIEQTSDFTNVSVMASEDQIAHGLLYAEHDTDSRKLRLIFKHQEGTYTQYGFSDGHIDVPLPDLYVQMELYLNRNGRGYEVEVDYVYVGSQYLPFVPLSNLYDGHRRCFQELRQVAEQKDIYTAKLCDGGVITRLVGQAPTVVDVINRIAANLTSYLMTRGNTDLNLRDSSNPFNTNATAIANRFSTGGRRSEFIKYWVFLNKISENRTPEQVYKQLSELTESRDIFNKFGITRDEIETIARNSGLD